MTIVLKNVNVTPETLCKRVGEDLKVKVYLYNSGKASGTVYLKVDVYDYLHNIWVRISPIEGTKITLRPKKSGVFYYSFKPFVLGYQNNKVGFHIKAEITGDCEDSYSKFVPFIFDIPPYVKWYNGKHEFEILEEWPKRCSDKLKKRTSFPYGKTVYLFYRAFDFENYDTVRALFTIVRKIKKYLYYLDWQGISYINPPQGDYYWGCYGVGWRLDYWPENKYYAFVTVELKPGYENGTTWFSKFFEIY